MEKRKVRIYKAQDGGNTNSLLSDFMTRAQYGTQQQADPQQLLMQVATMIAPAELGGQGNDPNQVYMQLAQSYGEQAASQLLTAAVQYVQQMQGGSGNTEDVAQEESQSPELSVQEELIAAERERQRMQEEESFAQQDDEFMDELLYAKDGGSINRIKKKFVNSAVKLAKKQLGESVENQQTKADSTDIMDGRNKKSKDFLSGIQNNVTLSQVEKQAENLFQQQYGGFTDGILSKFVYGGDDEYMYGGLSKAQKGKTVTDQWGNTKTLTEEELADWEMQRQSNPNLRLSDISFASESPSNLTDQQNAFLTAGKLNPYTNLNYPQYRFNPQPYSTNNFFDAMIPFNRGQYKTVYNMPKGMPYMPGMSDMSKYFTDSGITGFSTTKERLGPGAKKWTFSPEYGQTEKESADEMRQSKRGERQGPFSNFGEKLKYKFESRFGRPASEEKKVFAKKKGFVQAKEGLQKFQGIDQGNQVNNQSSNDLPYLKPKSPREAMDSWYTGPQTPDPIQDKDWSVEAYQFKEFDPQQALNATFMGGNWLASQAERFDKGNRQALANVYRNQTADNVYPDTDYTQPGTYAVNRDFAFRGQKPGAPEGEGFQGIVREGGRIMAKGGTPYPQRFGSLAITATAMGGNDADQYTGVKDTEVRDSISKVPKHKANLEAEGGETAYGDINGDGFPEHYKITGPRHTEGGVPLNLPDGTFIFSDTRSMMIKECKILKMFNKPCDKKGYTPAELAKQYDINKYRKILEDNTTDKLEKKTAELMIKQYVIKLGALALAQESKKGFPQGIPEVARPYMEAMGLRDEDILPQEAMPEAEQQDVASEDQMMMESEEGMMASPEEMMRYGGMSFAQDGIIQRSTPEMQNYIDTMNKYYYRKGMDQEFLPSGQGPMNENQMYNWNELQENLSPSSIPQKNISSPEDILNRMQETTEDCPCMQERLVQGVPQRICVPCEEMPMAAYGMEMGGYDIPFAQTGLIKGAKNLGRLANIGTLGTLNSIAKTAAPVMINPMHFPTFGMLAGERTMVGPFTGSPLNMIPFYGKDLKSEMEPNEAFRYFGDTLDYAKLNKTLDSAHGPLLRMGRNRVLSDSGQWFEQGQPNASYTSVFGVRANPDAPGSNLSYMPSGNRNGVLIGDTSNSNPRVINLNDSGITTYRRLPLSNRLSPVDLDNPWDWKNYGGNLQALAERYGYGALGAAGLGALGYNTPQEYLDEYVNEPVGNFLNRSGEMISDFMENPFNVQNMERPMLDNKRNGGQLDKYQVKGEVKKSPKVYTKDSLPEGAIIKTDKDAWNIQPGDFILQTDGTYRKATGATFNPNKVAVDTGTQQQTVQEFIAKDPIKNKELIDQANAVIEKGITDKTIVCLNKNCSQIKITGKFNPDFKDRIIISRALNSNSNFSTDKYKVSYQSPTEGYAKPDAKGSYKKTGSFVAGFTPEDYEKRYIFEKARGAGNTDEEAFAVVDQVYADPKLKAKFRREYANMLGLSNIPSTDEDLLKPDFYKTRYKDVTIGIENVLSKDFARPVHSLEDGEDDVLSGFEHFDAFGFSPDVKYEFGPDELKNETVNTLDPQGNPIDINVPVPEYAPYWLQDELKTAGAFNRMYSREDQYPPSFAVDYEEPRGPFLDPAREIASREETTNKMLNYLSSFAGPQTYAANASKFAGDESRDVAEILSKYNDANVQLARQDEYAGVDIRNKEADARRKGAYDLVNQTNLMKAKKQNTKLADMKYLEDQVTSAITNRWKTDTLNKLYPQYSIDPSIGGRLYGTGVTKAPRPDKGTDLESLYQKYYGVTGDKDQATKLAMLDYNKSVSNSGSDMYPAEAIMAMYKQYGGDVPEAQTGMELMRRGLSSLSNLPKTLGSLNMLRGAGNLGNLARFTGSSPADEFVTPIGSQTPIPLADLENLESLSSFMPAENTFLESNYPIMQAGFLGDKAKGLIPQDFSDLGRSAGRLIRPLGSRVALPESGILDESNLTGLGMLDVTSLSDDQLADIIRKVDFTKPIAEMQKSLHPMELEALMANKDRVNALRTNLPKPKRKPKTDTAPKAESTSKTELDSLALELYKQPYKDLNDSQMMDVISEYNWRKVLEPVKKTRAKKTTTSTRKKATPKPATDNTEMMKEAKEKMAMDNYGEPYDSLSSLAKKMIDVEIAKLFGSSQPPFRDGGMYLTGSNVFPFTGY